MTPSTADGATEEWARPRTDELATPRGETTIVPGVVAKLAGAAAAEVDGVELASATGLRGLLSWVRPGGAGASAEVASRRTAIDLHLSVAWPNALGSVTEQVRTHVRRRVQALTGYEVTDVDIVVDDLPVPSRRRGRVV